MEVGRVGRLSTSGRSETESSPDRGKHIINNNEEQQNYKKQHPKDRIVKMFNKVQVVYYLTRNGQLEHPHYLEVSHLATQPLRLKDVIDRLAVLRGKAMPCQYSWSCKRSYKNGYVWNDLMENDPIYASDGSEYVLKGSELLHERDFSSEIRLEELQIKQRQERKMGCHTKTNGMEKNKSVGIHQQHHYRQQVVKNYQPNIINKNNEEAEEEEEKGSCNSSNASPYTTLQIDQEESYSLPSTSSTNSDKQPPPPPPPKPPMPQPQATKSSSEQSRRLQKETSRTFIEEDGDPTFTTSLTRNSAILLHLIACGGGGIVDNNTNTQERRKSKSNNCVESSRNFNFSMKNNSLMPCLKQQLSTRPSSKNDSNVVKSVVESCSRESKAGKGDDDHVIARTEDDDDDMMMVRYMSENPRFGNLQSEEKEYFSGTIVETMATQQTHHQHNHSSGSQTPVFTKCSSYNELRSVKAGLGAAVASTMSDEEDKKEDSKVKGIIKLCIPRKKSFSTRQT